MTITEMRNKRAKLWNTMEGFLDTHRNDMGVLSAEDDAAYAKMEHDLDSLTNEIKRMERRDAIEAELNKPVNSPITEAPERAASLKPEKAGRASNAYKEDFDRHLRGAYRRQNILFCQSRISCFPRSCCQLLFCMVLLLRDSGRVIGQKGALAGHRADNAIPLQQLIRFLHHGRIHAQLLRKRTHAGQLRFAVKAAERRHLCDGMIQLLINRFAASIIQMKHPITSKAIMESFLQNSIARICMIVNSTVHTQTRKKDSLQKRLSNTKRNQCVCVNFSRAAPCGASKADTLPCTAPRSFFCHRSRTHALESSSSLSGQETSACASHRLNSAR